ncbi:hypothetical protein [Actinomyces weissii]|uniref:Uncharacterized protein n=1 Tax=Actinomyces weissii TaxID=675090 RepID=A0A7T7S152_9ACTO|nr:hypothetical protein [Actinomyces weissii]QQM66898.1 hypothetical protein JG540_07500 [Actinomyces weissii]
MRRRILSEILALAGLVVVILAVCSATIWRPSSTAVATLTSTPSSAYVVTRPGVLGVADPEVTITATATDASSPVTIAVARSADVQSWLANDPHEAVTNLDGWDKLVSQPVRTTCDLPGQEAGGGECTELVATGANPATSDLWLRTASGTGSVTLSVNAAEADLVALVATDGTSPAPSLSLSWPRTVSTPWLIPGLVLGGLLLLVGVFGFVLDLQLRSQEEARRARAAERAAHLATADAVSTAAIPQVAGQAGTPTRRQQRTHERAGLLEPETTPAEETPDVLRVPPVPVPTAEQVPTASFEPTSEQMREHVGASMGTAVIPGLAEEVVAAHRAKRMVPEGPAFEVATETGSDRVQTETDGPFGAAGSPADYDGQEEQEALVVPPVIEPMLSAGSADLTDTTRIPVVREPEPAAEPAPGTASETVGDTWPRPFRKWQAPDQEEPADRPGDLPAGRPANHHEENA